MVAEIAEELGVEPFRILCLFAKGDWKALELEPIKRTKEVQGQVLEEIVSPITMDMRLQAAREASKYLYPQRKAVSLSADEEKGFRVIVEDWTVKGKS